MLGEARTNANHIDYNLRPFGHRDGRGPFLAGSVGDLESRVLVCFADHDVAGSWSGGEYSVRGGRGGSGLRNRRSAS
jgi:hypothetical protein